MYFNTNSIARTYISGVIFFFSSVIRFPKILIITYEITPIEIPSAMLYIRGIHTIVRYAGTDSLKSLKSISSIAETIKNPTYKSAGAVANPGMEINIGENKTARRNMSPVTTDARPVLAPAPTPAELSTNVVVVDVPKTAPAQVATASARRASFTLGRHPFSSSIPDLFETPIKVPTVSNISTNKNEKHTTMKFTNPTFLKSKLKHCPKVSEILEKFVKCIEGYNE